MYKKKGEVNVNNNPFRRTRSRHRAQYLVMGVAFFPIMILFYELVVNVGMASFAADQVGSSTSLEGYAAVKDNSSKQMVCVRSGLYGCEQWAPQVTVNLGGVDTQGSRDLSADVSLPGLQPVSLFTTTSNADPNLYSVTTHSKDTYTYHLPYKIAGLQSTLTLHTSTTDFTNASN